jgi:hypothetical protein
MLQPLIQADSIRRRLRHSASLRGNSPGPGRRRILRSQSTRAAIPEQLTESKLFGEEKDGYTGATVSRPGRFERAPKSSASAIPGCKVDTLADTAARMPRLALAEANGNLSLAARLLSRPLAYRLRKHKIAVG